MTAKVKTASAKAAAAIKAELKSIGVKASCKSSNFSMGNSVRVTVYDQSPEMLNQINELCSKYQYGKFNGMDDSYDYTNTREDIPQAKYVSVEHELSNEYKQTLIDKINARYNLFVTFEQFNTSPWSIEFDSHFGARDFGNELYRLSTGAIDYEKHDSYWKRSNEVKDVLRVLGIEDAASGIVIHLQEDNRWSVGAYCSDRTIIDDDYSLPAGEMAKLLADAFYQRLKQYQIEQAQSKALEERNGQIFKPVSSQDAEEKLTVYFPACNKNHDITDNDLEIISKPCKTTTIIKKNIVLNNDDYIIVSESLLNDRPYLWDKIGGAQVDDKYLEGLTPHTDEFYKAWREHGETLGIMVSNAETKDCFIVNTEGYGYARYVGRTAEWYADKTTKKILFGLSKITID